VTVTDAVFTPEPSETKLARMKLAMQEAGFDAAPPSMGHFAVAPVARALYDVEIRMQRLMDEAFVLTASADGLTRKGADLAMPTLAATQATGAILFTGTPGTVVPAGWVVRSFTAGGASAIEATTDASVTLANVVDVSTATGAVAATVRAAGTAGNVPPGALIRPDPMVGLTSATNAEAFAGGTDAETTEEYRARLLFRLQHPSSSGNRADYVRWGSEVPGVRGVSAVGNPFGPGTVGLYVIGEDGLPASAAIVDAVLEHVANVFRSSVEAEMLAVSGSGVTGATLPTGAAGLRFAYNAGANGQAIDSAVQTTRLLDTSGEAVATADPGVPGIWRVIPSLMATGAVAGAASSLVIEVWNDTLGLLAPTAPSRGTAQITLAGDDYMTDAPIGVPMDVYFDGRSSLSLRVRRINTGTSIDTTTVWWLDRVEYRSAFTPANGDGLAPVGARVYVFPAVALPVTCAPRWSSRPTATRWSSPPPHGRAWPTTWPGSRSPPIARSGTTSWPTCWRRRRASPT
jgi:uncharacterized phage protein gp47/JayE